MEEHLAQDLKCNAGLPPPPAPLLDSQFVHILFSHMSNTPDLSRAIFTRRWFELDRDLLNSTLLYICYVSRELSPFVDIFPLFHNPTLPYIFKVSRELTRGESDGLDLASAIRFHRIRWSLFADIFHPLLNSILLHYIYLVSRELTYGESSCCSWPSSIGLCLGVLDNPLCFVY